MTPIKSLINFRSNWLNAWNAWSISDCVYSVALKRDGGPSPVASQSQRTFSNLESVTKCTPDKCTSLSFFQRRTTCCVTPNFFATAGLFNPAASIEADTRAPKLDTFVSLSIGVTGSDTKVTSSVDTGQISSLPRLTLFPRHRLGFFISFVHDRTVAV